MTIMGVRVSGSVSNVDSLVMWVVNYLISILKVIVQLSSISVTYPRRLCTVLNRGKPLNVK